MRKGGKIIITGSVLDIITSVGIRMSSRYVVQQAAPAFTNCFHLGGRGLGKEGGVSSS